MDTTWTKIFVGGLPYHTTDQSLREYFEQFGGIDEAVVITDRETKKSRGYGFVTMSDAGAADRACKDPNPIIDGRKANVNLAYLGAKPRAPPSGAPLLETPVLKPEVPGYGAQMPMMQQYRYVHPSAYLGSPAFLPVANQTHPLLAQQLLAQQQMQQEVSSTASSPKSGSSIGMDRSSPTAATQAANAQLAGGIPAAYQYALAANQLATFGYPYAAAVPQAVHPSLLAAYNMQQNPQDQLRLQQAHAQNPKGNGPAL